MRVHILKVLSKQLRELEAGLGQSLIPVLEHMKK